MTFVPLTDITVEVVAPRHHPDRIIDSIDLYAEEITTEAFMLTYDNEAVSLENLLSTIEQLTAFNNAVKKYGLTRSLIAFADYDKTLSTAIPAIPSLEALMSDRSVKSSAPVVASVEASIADAVSVFATRFKARIQNTIARIAGRAKKLDAVIIHITTLKDMVDKGRILDDKQLKTRQFLLLPHAKLTSYINAISKIEALVKHIVNEELPTNEATFKTWINKLCADFNSLGLSDTIKMTPQGKLDISTKDEVVRDNLQGHGYTKLEEFSGLVAEAVRIDKSISAFNDDLQHLFKQRWDSRNDQTMMWTHRAALTCEKTVWMLGMFVIWIGDPVIPNVLKALFACSEKKS